MGDVGHKHTHTWQLCVGDLGVITVWHLVSTDDDIQMHAVRFCACTCVAALVCACGVCVPVHQLTCFYQLFEPSF